MVDSDECSSLYCLNVLFVPRVSVEVKVVLLDAKLLQIVLLSDALTVSPPLLSVCSCYHCGEMNDCLFSALQTRHAST